MLDKTGTVTTGHMKLVERMAAFGSDQATIDRLVAGAEDASEHPIARAIAQGLRDAGIEVQAPHRVHQRCGSGCRCGRGRKCHSGREGRLDWHDAR